MLVNSLVNLPDGQVMFFEQFDNKKRLGLVEMTSGLLNASFSRRNDFLCTLNNFPIQILTTVLHTFP